MARQYKHKEEVKFEDVIRPKGDPGRNFITTMEILVEIYASDGMPGDKDIQVEVTVSKGTEVSHDRSLKEYIIWTDTGRVILKEGTTGFINLYLEGEDDPVLVIRNKSAFKMDWISDMA